MNEQNVSSYFPIQPKMKPVLPALCLRYTREEMLSAIEENHGLTTAIVNKLDSTFSLFYRCIKHYGLENELQLARDELSYKAENVLVDCLDSENEALRLRAAESILKMRGQSIGYNNGPQVLIQQAVMTDKDLRLQIQNIFGIK